MYGLVNQAIEDLVRAYHGGTAWELIKQTAQLQIEAFIGMEQYPDDVTYKLVDAASEVLGVPREEVLQSFGEHWVLFTAKKGYGEILSTVATPYRTFSRISTCSTRASALLCPT